VVSFAACMPACDTRGFTDHCNIPACVCNSAYWLLWTAWSSPCSTCLTDMSMGVLPFRPFVLHHCGSGTVPLLLVHGCSCMFRCQRTKQKGEFYGPEVKLCGEKNSG
jgi:hypothetical protein